MNAGGSETLTRFTLLCRRCDRPLTVRQEWVGREVRCPYCWSVMRVSSLPGRGRTVRAAEPSLAERRCFNFACPRCDCLLEAHTGMSGQPAQCPTCAARLRIPHLRGRLGLPEPAELLSAEAETPTPVHAYAASGQHAPRIVSGPDGTAVIECPRCAAHSPVDADTCTACGTPFTIEAASSVGQLRRDVRAGAAIALGIVGVVLCPTVLPAAAAVWLGLQSSLFAGPGRRSLLGLLGTGLGVAGLLGAAAFWYWALK